ncbi:MULTISPECIES: hypothetical protein [Streptomyces]|uniref:Uncharacterized protein n=1 Tax=Streptomyces stelliscabiei TaxID=146820 RepID=A0A8I0TPF5_9ACTN|nr:MULTISPECIES: hypothetical protein [Streptomyces]MBE1594801.1 hypothetical protein [Streptomyces stelliscabiei]MDX2519081.1 hypothetical protein [Streptomyces stelliscabiei]MDX2550936.1 hypothetical protein [Streptomyces stelliscabiei]MDX2616582.1 hypothetical protein [Streptomyces stelliscabiei]MDX2635677.1 hypothetical protein [Streptomyces stelliscabiei]
MLTAARRGGPRPDFEDCYPAQKAYYESLARDGVGIIGPAAPAAGR